MQWILNDDKCKLESAFGVSVKYERKPGGGFFSPSCVLITDSNLEISKGKTDLQRKMETRRSPQSDSNIKA